MYSSLTKFIYVTTVFAMGYLTGKRFSQKQYYCIIVVLTPGLISPVFVFLRSELALHVAQMFVLVPLRINETSWAG